MLTDKQRALVVEDRSQGISLRKLAKKHGTSACEIRWTVDPVRMTAYRAKFLKEQKESIRRKAERPVCPECRSAMDEDGCTYCRELLELRIKLQTKGMV